MIQGLRDWWTPPEPKPVPTLFDDDGLFARVHFTASCIFWSAAFVFYFWPAMVGATVGFSAILATRTYITISPPLKNALQKANLEWQKPGIRGAVYTGGLVALYSLPNQTVCIATAATVVHKCG